MRFVTRSRLQRIRQELERASGDTRIVDVMMNYGITQGGKFAKEYQQLFGEKPSDTLKRANQIDRKHPSALARNRRFSLRADRRGSSSCSSPQSRSPDRWFHATALLVRSCDVGQLFTNDGDTFNQPVAAICDRFADRLARNKLNMLTSCISLNLLLLSVDPGYPQGAPLQVNCVGVPLVGTLSFQLVILYWCQR